jgi:monoamine oxidase
MTPVEFFRHQGASPEAASLLMLGNDFDNVSVLYILRLLALDQNARVLYKIRGGNDRLPKAFAARLAEKIRYGAPVTRIERSEKGVRVVYLHGGAHQAIAGDRLVCTIPFPVLRHMEVSPPFSPEKRRAITEVPYLSVTRVFVQSKKRFWRDQGLNGFGRTDHPMEIWHPSFDQPGPRGILLSYMMGKLARRVGAMKEGERLSFAIEELEKVFPGTREHAEGGVSKSWDEDQWVRGAAAEFEPGQMSTLLPHVARAEGRVHFAGEHTSPWAAWMQGALESGLRAAREVNDAP